MYCWFLFWSWAKLLPSMSCGKICKSARLIKLCIVCCGNSSTTDGSNHMQHMQSWLILSSCAAKCVSIMCPWIFFVNSKIRQLYSLRARNNCSNIQFFSVYHMFTWILFLDPKCVFRLFARILQSSPGINLYCLHSWNNYKHDSTIQLLDLSCWLLFRDNFNVLNLLGWNVFFCAIIYLLNLCQRHNICEYCQRLQYLYCWQILQYSSPRL